MVQLLDYHYTDLAATPWMLIPISYASVMGLYTIQYKTVLCYIQTLPSQVPSEDELGICNIPDRILRYIKTCNCMYCTYNLTNFTFYATRYVTPISLTVLHLNNKTQFSITHEQSILYVQFCFSLRSTVTDVLALCYLTLKYMDN